jgi:hypothetical protein
MDGLYRYLDSDKEDMQLANRQIQWCDLLGSDKEDCA